MKKNFDIFDKFPLIKGGKGVVQIINKNISSFLFTLMISILAMTSVYSQVTDNPLLPMNKYDYQRFGIFGSFNLNQYAGSYLILDDPTSCCPIFSNGSGTGFMVGLLYEYPLQDNSFIGIRAGYLTRDGKFTNDEYDTVNVNGQVAMGHFRQTLEMKLANIGFEVTYNYRFFDNFMLHLGPQILPLSLTNKYHHQEELIEPPIGTFENGSRIRNVSDGEISNFHIIKLYLLAGLSYEVFLNNDYSWILAPEIFYSLAITKETANEDWRVNMLRLGLALKYSPVPEPEKIKIIEKPPPKLDADVNATGITYEGVEEPVVKVKVEEFLSTRMHPLLTYVFFDENLSVIPDRYKRISKEKAANSKVEDFHDFNALETYYHLLNIVGKRMLMYPDAKIVLDGCNSNEGKEKNNIELSKKRAEAVKAYLVNTWGIDPERIRLNPRNLPNEPSNPQKEDGIVENRRVEILSNTMEIIAPVITVDTLRVTNPPAVRFRTDYKGEAPLRNWTLLAKQKGKTLKTFEGDNSMPKETDWKFALDEKSIPKTQDPLEYQLIVHDNAGQMYESPVKSLPVEVITLQKKRRELFADKLIDRFSLILFTFDETKLTYFNTKVLEIIQSYIKPESNVKVMGFTDRMGEADYNLKLSQQRAQGVANNLHSDKKTVTGIGANDFLYDNNSPEGRYYCRRVDVTVETPIEFK